ncbi:MAG: LamG domain-containing protein [Candidatus Micrarchaeaceae archaeon]
MALIKTRKGILLTLVTIVLLVLMISELIMYVTLNISYNTLASQSESLSGMGSFMQMLKSGLNQYVQGSLSRALSALIVYEGTPSLRYYHFINNTQYALESLMYNGIIYGTNMSSYMNGTMQGYASLVKREALSRYFNITVSNASINVFQSSPFTLSALYTALAVINSSYGTFTYPINATATISLNGEPDLYSVEAADPQTIHAASALPHAVLVGNMYANSANTLSSAFAYGTIILNNGPTCSSVPSQFQNPYFILAMQNANDINSNLCNMGGLITSSLNATPPAKPYLVYPSSIFSYLDNGTKALLSGPGKSLLNISQIKIAIEGNYYYPSPYAPSYLDWANSTFKRSQNGIVSFDILHRSVASFNPTGATTPRAFVNVPTVTPLSYSKFTYMAWFYPTYPEGDSRVLATSAGDSGTIELSVSSPYIYINGYGTGGWLSTGAEVPMDGWSYIAGVYNGSGYRVYLNGALIWSKTESLSGATSGNFQIGDTTAYGNSGNQFFGSIGNVQIYDSALTQQQIYSLYKEGINGLPLSNSTLVGWWPLNGNANDYSGSGNNGIIYNATLSGLFNYSGDSLLWGTYYSLPKQIEGINCMNATQCGNLADESLYLGNLTIWSNATAVKNESAALGLQNAIR